MFVIKQLIKEILDTILVINTTTDHAAFFSLSGHVEKVEVWITQSKTEYTQWIHNADVWMAFPGDEDYNEQEAAEELAKMLEGLKQFLPVIEPHG